MAISESTPLPDVGEQDLTILLVPSVSYEKLIEISRLRGLDIPSIVDEALREYIAKWK